jgi:hypothetical protein
MLEDLISNPSIARKKNYTHTHTHTQNFSFHSANTYQATVNMPDVDTWDRSVYTEMPALVGR